MIKVENVSKSFEGVKALDGLNINVQRGSIYGLIGTNGAGKTTIIKHITGVFKADSGSIEIGGMPAYDNEEVKRHMGYVPDDLYFFGSYNLKEMSRFMSEIYPTWDQARYESMVKSYELDQKRRLGRFSKGMQKQAAFCLNMSIRPDYLILDEPIDGLDPIVRRKTWKYIVDDCAESGMTVLVSSHNLKEMEGICDSIGIISKGRMMIERELDELKGDVHKVQVAFRKSDDGSVSGGAAADENRYAGLNVLHREKRGAVELLIIRDKREKVEDYIEAQHPLVFDILPLSLEEIFIYELGGENDDIQGIF